MSKLRTEAVCHTLIFLLGTIVGIFACHTNFKGLIEVQHAVYAIIATVFFSFTQFKGLSNKKSQ
jgi:hypothetical protein